jgi:nucleotide-binding universal stress UspA family protein
MPSDTRAGADSSAASTGPASVPRRIIVPTDFSGCSDGALDYAVDLAQKLGAEVLVCFCGTVPDYEVASLVDPGVRAAALAMIEQTRAAAASWQAELDAVCRRKGGLGVPLRSRLLSGRSAVGGGSAGTAEAIAECAREEGADLIVIGSRSRPGVRHFFLGSVAERVLRLAPCPVLVVHPDPAT